MVINFFRAFMLQISITQNKNRNLLLNLLINCISARSTYQVFSTKDECTFRFLHFLISRLCSSSTNRWFDMISPLTEPPAVYL